MIAAMAEGREERILSMVKRDIERAMARVTNPKATKDELVRSLYTLCFSANQTVDVAECRGERLLAQQADDDHEGGVSTDVDPLN
ncbi:hypothetical protein [Streptomyces muensis]|uniref:Uncharacterized protein n=1 Tax=Streptomyces muensis TaxID=1077944 RepID=A0A9X1PXZ5_STRM4|nr:hypothetical protein [Streptomyces muensis]MCF1595462.1 hypothetical protein [Streptomyces muensis]